MLYDDDVVVERETASDALTTVDAHGVTSLDEEAMRLARKRLERIMLHMYTILVVAGGDLDEVRERGGEIFFWISISTIIFEKMDGGELLASKCVAENLKTKIRHTSENMLMS